MARSKVKITALGRRTSQSNTSQRNSGVPKKSKAQEVLHDKYNPPNLDYNVIEEIANGVEKMILSWNHLDEGEPEHIEASADENEPPAFSLWPGNNKVLPHDNSLKKKGFLEPGFCKHLDDVSFSDGMQERTPVPPELAGGTASDSSSLDVIVTEVVNHSGEMMADDKSSATYWYMEASNVVSPVENCTSEETSGTVRTDHMPSFQSLHQKRSRDELSGKPCLSVGKEVSNAHQSTPGTPPISERSVKRMQSQDVDGSNKKLQLSVSKKTRWSEKTVLAPVNNGSCCSEEECVKSPRSDCSLLDLASNCSWNDPLVGSPCRKLTPLSLDEPPLGQLEEFGPWASVAGHDPPVIVSRVTARSDADSENCAKEKTSFVSFKLWKANKESESGHEVGEASDPGKPSDGNAAVAPGSSSERDHDCGVPAAPQTVDIANLTSESVNVANPTSELQSNCDLVTGEMEELQIALLECATEYEIKTIDVKMKLKNIKNMTSETLSDVISDVVVAGANNNLATTDQLPDDEMLQVERAKRQVSKMQQVERVKRQVSKLQQQKASLSKELAELKKKERQFDLQKKSLDAALHKLDRLEWEMVKKEQEVEDWQQRQRQAEAQLQDSEMELQRLTDLGDLACLPVDTASLLSLLPTLRGFLQNMAQKQDNGYSSDDQSQQDDAALCDSAQEDEIVRKLLHEIQGLQHELSGMVGSTEDSPKHFKEFTQRQPRVQSGHKPTMRPSPRLPRDRYPYRKLSPTI